MVDENGLDCARLNEDFWEPSAPDGEVASIRDDNTEQQRLQLFTRPRRLTPAAETAGIVARSSSSGGSGGGWNSPGGSGGAGAGDEPPSAPRRPNRAATPQGQERVVSYQPEERYWTDYLRIALPVVGLLLMLGLFWYWASKVIGDSGNSPRPTATVQVAITTAEAPTATTQAVVQLTPQIVETATNTAGPATESNSAGAANNNAGTTSNAANPTATSAPSSGAGNSTGNSSGNSSANSSGGNSSSGSNPSKFGNGDTVQTSSDNVNMRSDHSITADPVETIAATGTELNVTGPGVKSGDYTWIPVTDPATGASGWVADSLVEAATP